MDNGVQNINTTGLNPRSTGLQLVFPGGGEIRIQGTPETAAFDQIPFVGSDLVTAQAYNLVLNVSIVNPPPPPPPPTDPDPTITYTNYPTSVSTSTLFEGCATTSLPLFTVLLSPDPAGLYTVNGYTISSPAPSGWSFDTGTGAITCTNTPTVAELTPSVSRNVTVNYTYGGSLTGSKTTAVTFFVAPIPDVTISYPAGTLSGPAYITGATGTPQHSVIGPTQANATTITAASPAYTTTGTVPTWVLVNDTTGQISTSGMLPTSATSGSFVVQYNYTWQGGSGSAQTPVNYNIITAPDPVPTFSYPIHPNSATTSSLFEGATVASLPAFDRTLSPAPGPTYTVTGYTISPPIPSGWNLSTNGLITYTDGSTVAAYTLPTNPHTVTVNYTYGGGLIGSRTTPVTFFVAPIPDVTISYPPGTLSGASYIPGGSNSTVYDLVITQTNTTPRTDAPIGTYSKSGFVPAWIVFNQDTGRISTQGTFPPATSGSFNVLYRYNWQGGLRSAQTTVSYEITAAPTDPAPILTYPLAPSSNSVTAIFEGATKSSIPDFPITRNPTTGYTITGYTLSGVALADWTIDPVDGRILRNGASPTLSALATTTRMVTLNYSYAGGLLNGTSTVSVPFYVAAIPIVTGSYPTATYNSVERPAYYAENTVSDTFTPALVNTSGTAITGTYSFGSGQPSWARIDPATGTLSSVGSLTASTTPISVLYSYTWLSGTRTGSTTINVPVNVSATNTANVMSPVPGVAWVTPAGTAFPTTGPAIATQPAVFGVIPPPFPPNTTVSHAPVTVNPSTGISMTGFTASGTTTPVVTDPVISGVTNASGVLQSGGTLTGTVLNPTSGSVIGMYTGSVSGGPTNLSPLTVGTGTAHPLIASGTFAPGSGSVGISHIRDPTSAITINPNVPNVIPSCTLIGIGQIPLPASTPSIDILITPTNGATNVPLPGVSLSGGGGPAVLTGIRLVGSTTASSFTGSLTADLRGTAGIVVSTVSVNVTGSLSGPLEACPSIVTTPASGGGGSTTPATATPPPVITPWAPSVTPISTAPGTTISTLPNVLTVTPPPFPTNTTLTNAPVTTTPSTGIPMTGLTTTGGVTPVLTDPTITGTTDPSGILNPTGGSLTGTVVNPTTGAVVGQYTAPASGGTTPTSPLNIGAGTITAPVATGTFSPLTSPPGSVAVFPIRPSTADPVTVSPTGTTTFPGTSAPIVGVGTTPPLPSTGTTTIPLTLPSGSPGIPLPGVTLPTSPSTPVIVTNPVLTGTSSGTPPVFTGAITGTVVDPVTSVPIGTVTIPVSGPVGGPLMSGSPITITRIPSTTPTGAIVPLTPGTQVVPSPATTGGTPISPVTPLTVNPGFPVPAPGGTNPQPVVVPITTPPGGLSLPGITTPGGSPTALINPVIVGSTDASGTLITPPSVLTGTVIDTSGIPVGIYTAPISGTPGNPLAPLTIGPGTVHPIIMYGPLLGAPLAIGAAIPQIPTTSSPIVMPAVGTPPITVASDTTVIVGMGTPSIPSTATTGTSTLTTIPATGVIIPRLIPAIGSTDSTSIRAPIISVSISAPPTSQVSGTITGTIVNSNTGIILGTSSTVVLPSPLIGPFRLGPTTLTPISTSGVVPGSVPPISVSMSPLTPAVPPITSIPPGSAPVTTTGSTGTLTITGGPLPSIPTTNPMPLTTPPGGIPLPGVTTGGGAPVSITNPSITGTTSGNPATFTGTMTGTATSGPGGPIIGTTSTPLTGPAGGPLTAGPTTITPTQIVGTLPGGAQIGLGPLIPSTGTPQPISPTVPITVPGGVTVGVLSPPPLTSTTSPVPLTTTPPTGIPLPTILAPGTATPTILTNPVITLTTQPGTNPQTVTGTITSTIIDPNTGRAVGTATTPVSGPATGPLTTGPTTITAIAPVLLAIQYPPQNTLYFNIGVPLIATSTVPIVTEPLSATSFTITPTFNTIPGITFRSSDGGFIGMIPAGTTSLRPSYSYIVTANGASSTQATSSVNLTIVILPPTPTPRITSVTYSPSQLTFVRNQPIVPSRMQILVSPPESSPMIIGYTVSPDLPDGIDIHPTSGFLSGTPLITRTRKTYTVTVRARDSSTSAIYPILSEFLLEVIATTPTPTSIVYPGFDTGGPQRLVAGTPIPPQPLPIISPPGAFVGVSSFTVNPPLPANLYINQNTGQIMGTYIGTTSIPATKYIVTFNGPGGSIESL